MEHIFKLTLTPAIFRKILLALMHYDHLSYHGGASLATDYFAREYSKAVAHYTTTLKDPTEKQSFLKREQEGWDKLSGKLFKLYQFQHNSQRLPWLRSNSLSIFTPRDCQKN